MSTESKQGNKPAPVSFRVRRPLVAKLIAMISLIVLLSMGAVTAFATWFFSADTRVRAEEQNLTLNELVAFQTESEVSSLYSGALSLLDTLNGVGARSALGKKAVNDFFTRNARVVYVGVAGKIALANRSFFESSGIEPSAIDAFLAGRAEAVTRACAGERLLVNASPWVGIASAALVMPYRDLGSDDALVIAFSTESLQAIVGGASVNKTYVVGSDGEVIAHPDVDLVLAAANLGESKIVEACLASASENLQTRFVDSDGVAYIGAFRKENVGQYSVITTVSESTVYSAALDVARQNIYITAIVLLFSVLAVWFFSKTVSRPVMSLVGAARKIEEGNYDLGIEVTTKDELGLLTESFAAMSRGLAERERIKETFGRFVNKDIAERALTGSLELGGVRKTATIMFSDIRSFTAISERLAPEAVVEFLNDYMTRMVDCVERTHGVVDKFIGDAIMAVWGTPVTRGSPEADALEAVKAMILMRRALVEFNRGRGSDDKPVIRIGCGVNTGPCLAGQIGSANRMEYTVIGDAVNLASRIEALNKPFGTDILISENTYSLVRKYVIVERMPPITVKGKAEPLRIYAVVNLVGIAGPKTLGELRSLLGIVAPTKPVDPDKEEIKYEIHAK